LEDATIYRWQVVAKSGVVAMPGPVWTFATVGAETDVIAADLNGDTAVNAVDIQLVINAVLDGDIGFFFDVNGDGRVDASDIQLVILDALGADPYEVTPGTGVINEVITDAEIVPELVRQAADPRNQGPTSVPPGMPAAQPLGLGLLLTLIALVGSAVLRRNLRSM
jgi:hypothetical protein